MAKKERSPEEQAARKAKSQAKRANRKAALVTVITFVSGRKNVPDEVKTAIRLITPGQRVGGGGPSKLKVFHDYFTEHDSASELDLFTKFKVARADMRKIRVNLIKKMKPADRIWVSHDPNAEVYAVEGYGAAAPSDWTGYRPVEVEDTEII